MNHRLPTLFVVAVLAIGSIGCGKAQGPQAAPANSAPTIPTPPWLGIPSAVSQVVVFVHDGTGWLLNKSEVSIKKVGDVRPQSTDNSELIADFQIVVRYSGESFETTATDVPCDKNGIPTEASVDRLRSAVEDIKAKMKRLQG